MKRILPVAIFAILLTGCVHQSPFQQEYYFQAMGADSEIVVTADLEQVKAVNPEIIGSTDGLLRELVDRAERFSIALYKDEYSAEDTYPAVVSDMDFYGAVEGNYGSFLINTGLSWSKEFHKEKSNGIKYYTDEANSIEIASPKSGIVLFSTKDYEEAYRKTISDRVVYIAPDTAKLLGDSVMGLYVKSPLTMINLGFELPYSVIMQMSDAILYVVYKDGNYYLNADIKMNDESVARTLYRLLNTQIMAEIRRRGERVDLAKLAEQNRLEGNTVCIRDRVMSDEQVTSFTSQITDVAGGLL